MWAGISYGLAAFQSGREYMRVYNWCRIRHWLLLGGFAVTALLLGSDHDVTLAGCIPEPNRTVTVTRSAGDELTDDTTVGGTPGNYTSTRHSGTADNGGAKRSDIQAPTAKPPLGEESCLAVGSYLYAWVEDGDTYSVSCNEWVDRVTSIWTVCQVIPTHVVPPNGGNDWLFTTRGQIKIIANANGCSDDGYSRAMSGSVTCKLITGRTVKQQHVISDNPAHTKKTNHVVVGGQISEDKETAVEADAKKNVAARIKQAQKAGASVTIEVTTTTEWTADAAIADQIYLPFEDSKVMRTFCHENGASPNETVTTLATCSVTAPSGSDDLYVEGYYFGEICTTVQQRIFRYCGSADPVVYATDWATLAGGDAPPAGKKEPHNPASKPADGQGDGGTASPSGQKGTVLAEGQQNSVIKANFEVEIPAGGEQPFFVRLDPVILAAVAEIASVTATRYDGSSDIDLSPNNGVFSAELTEGAWTVKAEIAVYQAATFYVEGCFTEEFESAQTVRSCVEAISHFLTPAQWEFGVHNGDSSAPSTIHLHTSTNTVVTLDNFATVEGSLDGMTVVWLLPNEEEVTWIVEPELVYDDGSGRWRIVLCPEATCTVDFTITLSDGNTVTIPIHCEVDAE
jgi:hypothetical protein